MQKAHETLERAFANIQSNYTNRASAVFPVYIPESGDTRVAFMNYWKHKNKIEHVVMNLRVYDAAGSPVARHSDRIAADAYDVSLREIAGPRAHGGMMEVEFISTENLRVPFPGINAFYLGNFGVSAVHSAGRIYNAEERVGSGELRETNWRCVFEPDVSPFFFVFNARGARDVGELKVLLRDRACRIVAQKTVNPGIAAPFSSRTIYLDELFPQVERGADVFAEVVAPVNGAFPRLIVGNHFRQHDHYQVTHSFEWQTTPHFVRLAPETRDDDPILAIDPIATTPDLDVEMVFYPTNAAGRATATTRAAAIGKELQASSEEFEMTTGGEGAAVVRYRARHPVWSIDFRSGEVPSRLNTSFEYSVKGSAAPFFTDVASGASALTVPRKWTCWGPAPVGAGMKTTLLVFNMSNLAQDRGANRATLLLYRPNGESLSKTLELPRESCTAVDVDALVSARAGEDLELASWMIHFERPVSRDTFWVSRAADGRVVADHCF